MSFVATGVLITFSSRVRFSTSKRPESLALFQNDFTTLWHPLECANGGDRTDTTVLAFGMCFSTSASISDDVELSECFTTATCFPESWATRTWRFWWSCEIQPGRPGITG